MFGIFEQKTADAQLTVAMEQYDIITRNAADVFRREVVSIAAKEMRQHGAASMRVFLDAAIALIHDRGIMEKVEEAGKRQRKK